MTFNEFKKEYYRLVGIITSHWPDDKESLEAKSAISDLVETYPDFESQIDEFDCEQQIPNMSYLVL